MTLFVFSVCFGSYQHLIIEISISFASKIQPTFLVNLGGFHLYNWSSELLIQLMGFR